MVDTVHKNLTGADLHEPKGADTALANQVYVSDGAGSGTWVAASSVISNTAWSTGDLKPTHKAAADTGWIIWIQGTIGDSSSGADVRANADCADLFALYWNGFSNSICAVSGGRGISAAADFAAHKTIALPSGPGRALAVAGSTTGLTTRTLGASLGVETQVLTQSQLPAVTLAFTGVEATITSNSTKTNFANGTIVGNFTTSFGSNGPFMMMSPTSSLNTVVSTAAYTPTGSVALGGSGSAMNVMQPTAFINIMIKL